jgi:hypothetical protein
MIETVRLVLQPVRVAEAVELHTLFVKETLARVMQCAVCKGALHNPG